MVSSETEIPEGVMERVTSRKEAIRFSFGAIIWKRRIVYILNGGWPDVIVDMKVRSGLVLKIRGGR